MTAERFYPSDLECANPRCGHDNSEHGFYGCAGICIEDDRYAGARDVACGCERFEGVRQDDRDLSEPTCREEAGL
jgi:hypothetical protein